MTSTNPILVLVEDDFIDQETVRRKIRKRKMQCDLITASDGAEALRLLDSEMIHGAERDRVLIFLDINMPGMNGHQFLDALRADPELEPYRVYVLTTSDHPRDRDKAMQNKVDGYFLKSNLDGLLDVTSIFFDSTLQDDIAHEDSNVDMPQHDDAAG